MVDLGLEQQGQGRSLAQPTVELAQRALGCGVVRPVRERLAHRFGGALENGGPDNVVHALAAGKHEGADAIYLGGWFGACGFDGVATKHIARWDGKQFAPLGEGLGLGEAELAEGTNDFFAKTLPLWKFVVKFILPIITGMVLFFMVRTKFFAG